MQSNGRVHHVLIENCLAIVGNDSTHDFGFLADLCNLIGQFEEGFCVAVIERFMNFIHLFTPFLVMFEAEVILVGFDLIVASLGLRVPLPNYFLLLDSLNEEFSCLDVDVVALAKHLFGGLSADGLLPHDFY